MALDPDPLGDYNKALQQLFDLLEQEVANATDNGVRKAINDLANDVGDLLEALDQEGIASGTAQLAALAPDVKAVNEQLTASQDKVNGWVSGLGDAVAVGTAMDKVIDAAAKLFK
jgi:hypothetical protein